jgi:methionine aminopeptidase
LIRVAEEALYKGIEQVKAGAHCWIWQARSRIT